ncbi:MAG TPA: phage protease [Thermoplasmata archaeon]|nr:phage protease [Thermoplasmata archaeon]
MKAKGEKKAKKWVAVWNAVFEKTGSEEKAFLAAGASIGGKGEKASDAEMRYDSIEKVPMYVRKRKGARDAVRWMNEWNETFVRSGSQSEAFAAANALVGLEAATRAEPIVCFASSVFPDWDAAAVYQVQVLYTGKWPEHPLYGDLVVSNADLADAVRNFRRSSMKPFLDYNHAITAAGIPDGEREAIGWMRDMWVEDLVGSRLEPEEAEKSEEKVLVLKAEYEVNAEANEKIREKKYALFSPTYYPPGAYVDSETGEVWGLTVIGGAATNIPHITGMAGFVAVAHSAGMAGVIAAEMGAKARLSVEVPEGTQVKDSMKMFASMGLDVEWCDKYGACVRVADGGDLMKAMKALDDAGYKVTYFSAVTGALEVPASLAGDPVGKGAGAVEASKPKWKDDAIGRLVLNEREGS